ncbi:MAG: ATP-binding cassette domain-containing protein [Acutalibacteraceae bacterium]
MQNVSMHILPGQKIAVIGGTGSGKSTLRAAAAVLPSADRRDRSSSTASALRRSTGA